MTKPKKKTNAQRIDEIDKKMVELRSQKEEIEQEEFEKIQVPFLKNLVGECFVYRDNSYSCPKNSSDRWDVYRKISKYFYDSNGNLSFVVEEFQIDKYGKVELVIDTVCPYTNKEWFGQVPFSGYVGVDKSEYDKQKAKVMSELVNPIICIDRMSK